MPTLACAAVLLLACALTSAAAQGVPTPEAKPTTPEAKPATQGEGPKTEPGDAAKHEDSAPSPEAEAPVTEASEDAPVSLGDLTREGFEISTTAFVPAEAVTRQSGKVSSDAIVVTLQKSNATAICFYTLKAYVGKKLTTIPACTVHR
jgi:hypothetical protein